jgi:hypothetical protein
MQLTNIILQQEVRMLLLMRNKKYSSVVFNDYEARLSVSELYPKGAKYRLFKLEIFLNKKPHFDTLFGIGIDETVDVLKYIPKNSLFRPTSLSVKLFFAKPGGTMLLGFQASSNIRILREEIYEQYKIQKVS